MQVTTATNAYIQLKQHSRKVDANPMATLAMGTDRQRQRLNMGEGVPFG
jgi:hypothetical protein